MDITIGDFVRNKTAMMNNASNVPIHSSVNLENNVLTTGRFLFDHNHPAGNDPVVLRGIYENREIAITFSQLRGLVSLLHDELYELGIHKGTSIMLVSFPSTSELLKSIYFIALVTMGARVSMPEQSRTEDLQDWISRTNLQYALIPGKEILRHERHEKDNAVLLEMNDIFISRHVALLDTVSSFPLAAIISTGEYPSMNGNGGKCQAYQQVSPGDEALILSIAATPGTKASKAYSQQEIVQQAAALKLPISVLFHPMAAGESSLHKSFPSRPLQ